MVRVVIPSTSGYWWRHCRARWSEEERVASDAAWAAANGDEALQLALDSTEWVLRLPFPPPDANAPSPAGQIGPLTTRAASGVPEL